MKANVFSKKKVYSFKSITLRLAGMRTTDEIEVINKEENAELSFYRIKYDGKEDTRVLEESVSCDSQKIIDLLNECKVLSWDGFYGKHPKNVKDGIMFNFVAIVNEDETIKASGSENFPKNYREFLNSLYELLRDDK